MSRKGFRRTAALKVALMAAVAVTLAVGGAGRLGTAPLSPAAASAGLNGDVDCSGAVNSVDSLKVLRKVAGLSVQQTEPCTDVGLGLGIAAFAGSSGTGPGGAEKFSVDMAIAGNSANSLGVRQDCVQAAPGATVTIDVTATNIPGSHSVIGFTYELYYANGLDIVGADHDYLLAQNPGSSIFDIGDSTPDTDGQFSGGAVDLDDVDVGESGSGVLTRLVVAVDPAAANGVYDVDFFIMGNATVDLQNNTFEPGGLEGGNIVVGGSCEGPVPTPTPTPTPGSAGIQGDMNCDGVVTAVDALLILRYIAALAVNLPGGCAFIGSK